PAASSRVYRRLPVHRVPGEGLGRRAMGRALAGAVPGLRPPFGNGSQFGAAGQDDAVGVLAILAVPVADRVLGRSEGRSWRHNPRDPRRVRSESPTYGRAAGGPLSPRHGTGMGFARRMHLSDRHDPGPTLLPPATPRLVVLSDPGAPLVPLREPRAPRRGSHGSARPERGHGGPWGPSRGSCLDGDLFASIVLWARGMERAQAAAPQPPVDGEADLRCDVCG